MTTSPSARMGILAACLMAFLPRSSAAAMKNTEEPQGIAAVAANGKPLNLDFEQGSLADWKATGDAFNNQPVRGDAVHQRRRDMKSEHAGEYWIGGFERAGDRPQGTLTSVPFTVTHPWAGFLVAGGPYERQTCVELVRADTQEVFFRVAGHESENLERVVIDLKPHLGKQIMIRLVDQHSGHWGHINFDDFKFYASKPQINMAARTPAEVFPFAGLTPEEAAKAMTVPDGFHVSLFAGEPEVVQPIAMATDHRGRLWVAESLTYPIRQPEGQGKDRILIFEDTDGDGKADKRKVFADGLNLVSGLEVGFNGVWVGAAPYLLFFPDHNGDDVPDAEPTVLLDGWGHQDTHETLNAFRWGPDGWLYGCHGVFTHSRVGKPGTPDADRVAINAGIWRYHPTEHRFEVFAHGTSNPWGVDFDERGQCFATACVIPHLFHIVQGGRFERQAGQHFNPHTYNDIKTIADHRHYVGNQWNDRDRAASDNTGGGHAHAGAMIYLGGAWPAKYRGQIFMNNIHGARINMDSLAPAGSGYVGSHGPDFLLANDLWSQIVYLQYGPDGNVYMIDWYDKNQCHRVEPNAHDRSNGRIFKVSYRSDRSGAARNLATLNDRQLVELQTESNDWQVQHARRILQERAALGKLGAGVRKAIEQIAFQAPDATRRLRGLWALHATGGLTDAMTQKALRDSDPFVRAWTVQLASEDYAVDSELLDKFTTLAKQDPSPVVRLYLASALQRIEPDRRWPLLENLLARHEDAADHNLPLMTWYALEPMAELGAQRALRLAVEAGSPHLTWMTRRIAAAATPDALATVIEPLRHTGNVESQQAILQGMADALKGRRQVPMPAGWTDLAKKLEAAGDRQIKQLVSGLAVTFGEATAMAAMRKKLGDGRAPIEERREALASLLNARDPNLAAALQNLLDDDALRRDAIRGLAAYDDPRTADAILNRYASLNPEEKRDSLNTLAARPATARQLVQAVAQKKLPIADLSADVLRQLRNIKDEQLANEIAAVWGSLRDTAEDKLREIRRVRGMLAARQARPDELPHGRAVFAKTCQQCHTLFGAGAKIGPDLTGSNRADLDYLLSNVLDPSAVMAKEYQPNLIATNDGRVITGLVLKDDGKVLTVATANDTITLPRSDIEEMKLSDRSMMPDDLLKPLADDDIRALIAYLASARQVAMRADADNVKGFFNGNDLTGWNGAEGLWSVENGEIVGKTDGLEHNEFLMSDLLVDDFKLSLDVRLLPNGANSGIQFRSEPMTGGEMRGPQADIGAGWWGKLYEENGRGLLWDQSGEAHVRPGEWNHYEIVAVGDRVRTFINGQPCVDLQDTAISRRGVIALQIHSGGATEVRFKNLKLELKDGL